MKSSGSVLRDQGYRRTRNLFNPAAKTPYKLSRTRLEGFLRCPRCFYLDRRLGVEPPAMPAFTLNSAVDELLKKEFDIYRRKGEAHPLMKQSGIDAVPFLHPMLDEWREVFKGVQYHHAPTNFIITGAVDDLWISPQKEIFVVDYKATSTTGRVSLDGEYRQAYKRQMEIYQWLLSKQGFQVSNKGYFVYCNADKAKGSFDGRLEFDIDVLCYEANSQWVEQAIVDAHQCLMADRLPASSENCEHCQYRKTASELENPRPGKANPEFQHELFNDKK